MPATCTYHEPDQSSPCPPPISLPEEQSEYDNYICTRVFQVVSLPHVSPPLLSTIGSTCSAHLILLDLITRITFVEDYKSLSSSLCFFLHYPVTSSLLGPNILLSTLFSNNLNRYERTSFTTEQSNRQNLSSVYLYVYIWG